MILFQQGKIKSYTATGLKVKIKRNYLLLSQITVAKPQKAVNTYFVAQTPSTKNSDWQGCKSSATDLDISVNQATNVLLFAGLEHKKARPLYLQQWPANCRRPKWTAFVTLTFCRWMTAETLCCSCCYLQATAHWAESVTWSDHDGWHCRPVRITPNSWTHTHKHTQAPGTQGEKILCRRRSYYMLRKHYTLNILNKDNRKREKMQ